MAKQRASKATWVVDEAKGTAMLQGLPLGFVVTAVRRRKREDYAWSVRIGAWFMRGISPNMREACQITEQRLRNAMCNILALVDHAEQNRKAIK